MSKKVESKTKKEIFEIAPGIRGETYKRQGVTYAKTIYETDHRAAMLEMAGAVFGEEKINALAVWAAAWLNAKGLPCEKRICYAQMKKAGSVKISEIITKAELEERYENVDPETPGDGGRFGVMWLPSFIEKLGYGRYDYEYLMAEIIIYADRILDTSTPRGTVLDATFYLGGTCEKIQFFLRGDKQRRSGGTRDRESLKPNVQEILEGGGEWHYMAVLSELEKKGIARGIGDRVQWGKKSITIKRFENIVYEVKKAIK